MRDITDVYLGLYPSSMITQTLKWFTVFADLIPNYSSLRKARNTPRPYRLFNFTPLSNNYGVQLNNRFGRGVFLAFHKLDKFGIKSAKTVNHFSVCVIIGDGKSPNTYEWYLEWNSASQKWHIVAPVHNPWSTYPRYNSFIMNIKWMPKRCQTGVNIIAAGLEADRKSVLQRRRWIILVSIGH